MQADPWTGDVPPVEDPSRRRIESIDVLRGLVMVLMALDHTRDYVAPGYPPEVVDGVAPLLFFTRWITHLCAPVFVFLAGTSAYMHGSREGVSRSDLARWLIARGVLLIVLEVTVVYWSWTFGAPLTTLVLLQVLWALGVSMIVLAACLRLPTTAIAVIGIAMIATHNLLDGLSLEDTIREEGSNPLAVEGMPVGHRIYAILHVGFVSFLAHLPFAGDGLFAGVGRVFVIYPLVPWIGVMMAGYGFGRLMQLQSTERRALCLLLGIVLTAAFLGLRGLNLYGDPRPWTSEGGPAATVISVLNTQKYPPSLQFLLMTLGPALVLLGLAEGMARGPLSAFLRTFGRVPLFFYVLHIPLVHFCGVVYMRAVFGYEGWRLWPPGSGLPGTYEPSLLPVYFTWALCVAMLYPLCRAWDRFKGRKRLPLLRYF